LSEKQAELKFNNYTNTIVKLVGNNALWTNQVNELGHKYFGSKFHGTYSSDQLPTLTSTKPYAVINVDSSRQSGSHWVALCYCASKKQTLIFDSFGRLTRVLIPSVFKKYNTIDTDYDHNQLISQNTCGQKSLAFIRIFDKSGFKVAKLI
jgi:hypothetical protein